MQLKDTRREIKTIDLLPLINVVFLLILFVLIAGRPSTNHPSGLEVARSTVETTHQGSALSVWLKQDDAFYLSESKAVTLGELSQLVEKKGWQRKVCLWNSSLTAAPMPRNYWPFAALWRAPESAK